MTIAIPSWAQARMTKARESLPRVQAKLDGGREGQRPRLLTKHDVQLFHLSPACLELRLQHVDELLQPAHLHRGGGVLGRLGGRIGRRWRGWCLGAGRWLEGKGHLDEPREALRGALLLAGQLPALDFAPDRVRADPQARRLAKVETISQRSEPRRYLVLDEQPDGRLVDRVTREAVEPGPKDTVMVIRERPAGPQE